MLTETRKQYNPDYTVLAGLDVCLLPSFKLDEISYKVSEKLLEQSDKTIPCPKTEILDALKQGLAIVVLERSTNNLAAFAQIVVEKDQEVHFRSWISLTGNGAGQEAIMAGSDLGTTLYPNKPIIATVRNTNDRALKLLQDIGGKVLPSVIESKTRFNISEIKRKPIIKLINLEKLEK